MPLVEHEALLAGEQVVSGSWTGVMPLVEHEALLAGEQEVRRR